MPWWRFWEQGEEPPADRAATETAAPPPRSPRRPAAPETADPAARQRLAQLQKRRELLLFDLERAEAARRPENPWQERIDLLGESIATVEADLAALDHRPPDPTFPLPETPITGIEATTGEPAAVCFDIGPERFHFEEETDWDQRGGPRVRGDLRQRAGNSANLVPAHTPPALRDALAHDLADSVAVFAIDLRDRALDGEPLPEHPTLADLARPCPKCGGWRDWRGTCDACTERAWRRQGLRAERTRLEDERAKEADDRAKWAERLPVARRRLADVEAELAKLGG